MGQSTTAQLNQADSLYARHQYTQAYTIYEQLLNQQKVYTPQMLLKMAYIQEGLQNYTQSMYYLQLFYSKQPSRSILRKMEEVGLQQHLQGYAYTDLDFFKTQFHKYYDNILELLLIGAVIFLTLLVRRWLKKKTIPKQTQGTFLVYLAFIFFYANFLTLGQQGILLNPNVPIMTAPSAGAGLVTTAGVGHRVNIVGEQDIWYRIEWEGQTAYIRKNNLRLLPQPLSVQKLF
jgi:hypothetical protein